MQGHANRIERGEELGRRTGLPAMADYWRGVLDGDPSPYLQRILNGSNIMRGIQFDELHASCKDGVPALVNARTYPRTGGWEQRNEDKPWYNATGRLEFYRPEPEFQEAGESLPVHREPVDATFYDPNTILANAAHPSINPKGPEAYGNAVSKPERLVVGRPQEPAIELMQDRVGGHIGLAAELDGDIRPCPLELAVADQEHAGHGRLDERGHPFLGLCQPSRDARAVARLQEPHRAALVRVVGTQMPGEIGNFAVAAHRTTWGKPFNRIAELRGARPRPVALV